VIRLISVTTAALALAASGFAQNPRALFQDIYARIDAAVAAKDQAAIDRLIAADAQTHVGPIEV
jgi:hypothetical protein